MRCPFCGHTDTSVKDSRASDENAAIRRRRHCENCSARFTTVERVQLISLMVRKRDDAVEPFQRDKLAKSLYTALHKRSVRTDHVERVINSIVRQLEILGENEIPAEKIGTLTMEALKDLDTVAYVRFASVYRQFNEPEDFEAFIKHSVVG